MSEVSFLVLVDWIMKTTVDGVNTGITWKLRSKLDNLDFADDIAVASGTKAYIQQKVLSFSTNSKALG